MKLLRFLFGCIFFSMLIFLAYVKNKESQLTIEHSVLVEDIPKATLYNYLSDFSTWKDWNNLLSGVEIKSQKEATLSYDWNNEKGKVDLTTIKTTSLDTLLIEQELLFDTLDSVKMNWRLDKEKLELKIEGDLNFMGKVWEISNGNFATTFSPFVEKSLKAIRNNLNEKLGEHRFKFKDSVSVAPFYYIYKEFVTPADSIKILWKEKYKELMDYTVLNKIETEGKPFAVYPQSPNKLKRWRVAIPVPTYIQTKSIDVKCRYYRGGMAMEGVHLGDDRWLRNSWKIMRDSLRARRKWLTYPAFERYSVGEKDDKDPLNWETEIIFTTKYN